MNRFRYLAIALMLAGVLAAPAEQSATASGATDKDKHGQRAAQSDAATIEQQLKVVTEKLDLSGDQQARMKPILQRLYDATQKLVHDKSLSHEERLEKVSPERYKADRQMREILSDDQKRRLDEFEQSPQAEMLHGDLRGETSSPPQ